jgi:hypothetical protein
MIRWEQHNELGNWWYGYVGKIKVFEIYAEAHELPFITFLMLSPFNQFEYSSLENAKRGAERQFRKFLKDAGLEVKK